jgi:hypothetical protein
VVAVIDGRVSDTAHVVAVNGLCVADTDYSVTVIAVYANYASHIYACVTGTDAITSGMWDFTEIFSIFMLLFPILRWA